MARRLLLLLALAAPVLQAPDAVAADPRVAIAELRAELGLAPIRLGGPSLGTAVRNLLLARPRAPTTAFGRWRRGWTLARNLDAYPDTRALVLDPRATRLSVAPTAAGLLLVGVTVDPSRPFGRPPRYPPAGLAQPGGAVSVLAGPGARGTPRVLERRGVTFRARRVPVESRPGLAGARLYTVPRTPTVDAFERPYMLRIGPRIVQLGRLAIPAAVQAGTWNFGTPSTAQRRAFLAVTASAPRPARLAVGRVDAGVRVRFRACASGGVSCAGFDNGWFIRIAPSYKPGTRTFRFIVAHEIGHIVQFRSLDAAAKAAFLAAFRSSSRWRACFPFRGGCVSFDEIFADQFAFYVTDDRVIRSTYNVPPLLSRDRFGAVLSAQSALRLIAPPRDGGPDGRVRIPSGQAPDRRVAL